MMNCSPASCSLHDCAHIRSRTSTVEVALQSFNSDILALIIYTMLCMLVTCILFLLWGLWLPKNHLCPRHTAMTKN